MTDYVDLSEAVVKSSGSTTARSFAERFAQVLDVKDYGAKGDNSTDDRAAIQGVLDMAFGTAGSPHGSASAHQNVNVLIPNGRYKIGAPGLNVTKVVGGRIFGFGPMATQLIYNGASSNSLFTTNGAANLHLEKMSLASGGISNITLVNLDFDGTGGGDGLHDNVFADLALDGQSASGGNGIVIADSDNEGYCNSFEQVACSTFTVAGIDVRGTAAHSNVSLLGGSGANCSRWILCSGGQMHIHGPSLAANTYDIEIAADWPINITGGRTETDGFLLMSAGNVTVESVTQSWGSAIEFATVNGGRLKCDSVDAVWGSIFGDSGTEVWIRGSSFPANFLDYYYGTVVQNI